MIDADSGKFLELVIFVQSRECRKRESAARDVVLKARVAVPDRTK